MRVVCVYVCTVDCFCPGDISYFQSNIVGTSLSGKNLANNGHSSYAETLQS